MNLYKSALANLEAARKLIRPFKHWTVGQLAVRPVDDGYGEVTLRECSPKNKNATAFCALGAVRHVNGPGEKKALNLLRIAALQIQVKDGEAGRDEKPRNDHVISINDLEDSKENHRRVLKLFSRAIKLAKRA